MHTRPLGEEDIPALEAFLMRAPEHNPFHLGALREHGLASPYDPQGRPWAIGVFHESQSGLAGVAMALRGTGGIYHDPDDYQALDMLGQVVVDRAADGNLTLLSGHATQIGPLMNLVAAARPGHADLCYFRTLYPDDLSAPGKIDGFAAPRIAGDEDMEKLIDFYETGFYSLARLPTRAAWRTRLSEQLAFRTLCLVEDAQGKVASAALSSAEGRTVAMLGGVATLNKYRGIGLSTLCVAALCDHLFRSGKKSIALFYLKGNDSAARVYDKLGFQDAGEWMLVPLGFGAAFAPLFGMQAR